MLFYNKRSRDYNYFKIFLAVFAGISCSIVVYFLFSKINIITGFLSKLLSILTPVILGIVFAYLLNPLIQRLEDFFDKYDKIKERKKLGRILAIVIVYLIIALMVVIFIKYFIPSILDSINLMFKNIPKYLNNVFDFLKRQCEKYNISSKFIDSYRAGMNEMIKNSVVPNIDTIINSLATGITSVVKWIINIVVSVIISIYLIYDKETFIDGVDRALKAVCSDRIYEEVADISHYIYKVFGGFLVAKAIDSLIIGLITLVILSIFKIPYALLISLIVCITNIIPFFGPFIGAIPSIVLLLMISPAKALEFGIIILIIQQFDGNILSPKLIGDKIGMKSFWVLFAILLFGGLFGFIGMILAVPLFACIAQFIRIKVTRRLEEKRKEEEEERAKAEKKSPLRRRKILNKTEKVNA